MEKVNILTKVIHTVFSCCSDILTLEDSEGRILSASASWERALGWTERDLSGRHLEALLRLDPTASSEHRNSRLGGVVRHREGAWLRVSWICTAIPEEKLRLHVGHLLRPEETPSGNEGIHRNLSEREDSTTSEILAHELRTALHGIQGGLSLLANELASPSTQDALDLAYRSARQMGQILERTLNRTGTNEPEFSLVEEPLWLPPLLRDVVDICLASSPSSASFSLSLDIAPALEQQPVLGDATWIRRIWLDVMRLAMQLSPQGPLIVSAQETPEGVVIEVIAQGSGMKEEELAQLFLPRKRSPQVSGQPARSLASAWKQARLLGGFLQVTSRPGQDTTARVSLPLALVM